MAKLSTPDSMTIPLRFEDCRLVNKHQAVKELGISETTLKGWRNGVSSKGNKPELAKGVYWCQPGGSTSPVLYNLDLIRDWMFSPSPEAHQAAVTAVLASMPSSRAVSATQKTSKDASAA